MSFRTSLWLCKSGIEIKLSRAGLRAAWLLACSGAFFSPTFAHAAIADVNRIFHQTPSLNALEVCQGGGCAESDLVSISVVEWENVTKFFKIKANNAAEERRQIGEAIGVFEKIVGEKNGTATDLAGTFDNGETPGQMDCNDEAINTTSYLRLLQSKGLMQFHEVKDMRTRNFFFTGWPHSTASIRDTETGEIYAVDSWFYDNGHAATIVPLATWKANYKPADSPIGKPGAHANK
jgi:hypothetical protein